MILTAAGATAQIAVRQNPVVDKPVMRPEPFDSLTNLINEWRVPPQRDEKPNMLNFKRYIGQQIFFLPKSSHADDAAKKEDQVTRYNCFYNLDLKPSEYNYTYPKTSWVRGREKVEQQTDILKTDRYKPVFVNTDLSSRGFYTPADSVEGRYFVILDVGVGKIRSRGGSLTTKEEERYLHDLTYEPLTGESQQKYFGQSVHPIFTLQPVEGGEPFLMVISTNYDFCNRGIYRVSNENFPPPMLLVSFYERMRRDHVGKNFIAEQDIRNLIDINTGQPVTISSGSKWKCTDLSLMELSEAYMQPCYVLENETSAVKFPLVSPSDLNAGTTFPYAFISEERYEERERLLQLAEEQREKERQEQEQRLIESRKQFEADCIAQFGPVNGKYIANGQVVLGMTKAMCEAAWGTPQWVNTTIVSGLRNEQWVYSYGKYLYFDNGKLTAIQNIP